MAAAVTAWPRMILACLSPSCKYVQAMTPTTCYCPAHGTVLCPVQVQPVVTENPVR